MLIITDDLVSNLLQTDDCIESQENAFMRLAHGGAREIPVERFLQDIRD